MADGLNRRWRQRRAGLPRGGHVRRANDPLKKIIEINGVKVGVEWPRGSVRTWPHLPNNDYRVKMKADYGYIRQTEGEDGEEVDVYAGPDRDSDKVFKIEQLKKKKDGGGYDEDKFILGVGTKSEARALYLRHMDRECLGDVEELHWIEFLKIVPKSQGGIGGKTGKEKTAAKKIPFRKVLMSPDLLKPTQDDSAIDQEKVYSLIGEMEVNGYGFESTEIPPVIAVGDESGAELKDGHHRVDAARYLSLPVPVVLIDPKVYQSRGQEAIFAAFDWSERTAAAHPGVLTLYHGTSSKNLESIKREGLRGGPEHELYLHADPEEARGWGSRNGDPVVLGISMDVLDESKLRADYQVADDSLGFDPENKAAIDLVNNPTWQKSLSVTGAVAYLGAVPPENIEFPAERRAAGEGQDKPVCPNCGQWQYYNRAEKRYDCSSECAKRGFASNLGKETPLEKSKLQDLADKYTVKHETKPGEPQLARSPVPAGEYRVVKEFTASNPEGKSSIVNHGMILTVHSNVGSSSVGFTMTDPADGRSWGGLSAEVARFTAATEFIKSDASNAKFREQHKKYLTLPGSTRENLDFKTLDPQDRKKKIDALLDRWNKEPDARQQIGEQLKSLRAFKALFMVRSAGRCDRDMETGPDGNPLTEDALRAEIVPAFSAVAEKWKAGQNGLKLKVSISLDSVRLVGSRSTGKSVRGSDWDFLLTWSSNPSLDSQTAEFLGDELEFDVLASVSRLSPKYEMFVEFFAAYAGNKSASLRGRWLLRRADGGEQKLLRELICTAIAPNGETTDEAVLPKGAVVSVQRFSSDHTIYFAGPLYSWMDESGKEMRAAQYSASVQDFRAATDIGYGEGTGYEHEPDCFCDECMANDDMTTRRCPSCGSRECPGDGHSIDCRKPGTMTLKDVPTETRDSLLDKFNKGEIDEKTLRRRMKQITSSLLGRWMARRADMAPPKKSKRSAIDVITEAGFTPQMLVGDLWTAFTKSGARERHDHAITSVHLTGSRWEGRHSPESDLDVVVFHSGNTLMSDATMAFRERVSEMTGGRVDAILLPQTESWDHPMSGNIMTMRSARARFAHGPAADKLCPKCGKTNGIRRGADFNCIDCGYHEGDDGSLKIRSAPVDVEMVRKLISDEFIPAHPELEGTYCTPMAESLSKFLVEHGYPDAWTCGQGHTFVLFGGDKYIADVFELGEGNNSGNCGPMKAKVFPASTVASDPDYAPGLEYANELRKTAAAGGMFPEHWPDQITAFMQAFWEGTQAHPFMRNHRIWDNEVVMEVAPWAGGADPEYPWVISLKWLQAMTPGQGHATRAMQWLSALADEYGVFLDLHAKPTGEPKIPKTKLKNFYKDQGFERDRAQGPDDMIRNPKSGGLLGRWLRRIAVKPMKSLGPSLDKANNFFGKLDPDIRRRIVSYMSGPSADAWDDIKGIIISAGPGTGLGRSLWQAMLRIDPSFPQTGRSKDTDGNIVSDWARIPTPEQLMLAIELVVGRGERRAAGEISPNPDEDHALYEWQDSQVEQLPKQLQNVSEANWLGVRLENSGDIFRELTGRHHVGEGYVAEKVSKIERYLNEPARFGMPTPESLAIEGQIASLFEGVDRSGKSPRFSAACDLNIALAKRDWKAALDALARVRNPAPPKAASILSRWMSRRASMQKEAASFLLYHGSDADFDSFEEGHKNGWSNARQGFYFTDDQRAAGEFGRVRAFRVTMENPADLRYPESGRGERGLSVLGSSVLDSIVDKMPEELKGKYDGESIGMLASRGCFQTPEFIAATRAAGFDGIIMEDMLGSGGSGMAFDSYIAFDASQIVPAEEEKTEQASLRGRWLSRTAARRSASSPDDGDQTDYESYAAQYCSTPGHAAEYEWRYDAAFPVSKTTWGSETPQSARKWLKDEERELIAVHRGEPLTEQDKLSALEDTENPIVLVPHGDTDLFDAWDGNHRLAEAVSRGIDTLPAIVGSVRLSKGGSISSRWLRRRAASAPMTIIGTVDHKGRKRPIHVPTAELEQWNKLRVALNSKKFDKADEAEFRAFQAAGAKIIDDASALIDPSWRAWSEKQQQSGVSYDDHLWTDIERALEYYGYELDDPTQFTTPAPKSATEPGGDEERIREASFSFFDQYGIANMAPKAAADLMMNMAVVLEKDFGMTLDDAKKKLSSLLIEYGGGGPENTHLNSFRERWLLRRAAAEKLPHMAWYSSESATRIDAFVQSTITGPMWRVFFTDAGGREREFTAYPAMRTDASQTDPDKPGYDPTKPFTAGVGPFDESRILDVVAKAMKSIGGSPKSWRPVDIDAEKKLKTERGVDFEDIWHSGKIKDEIIGLLSGSQNDDMTKSDEPGTHQWALSWENDFKNLASQFGVEVSEEDEFSGDMYEDVIEAGGKIVSGVLEKWGLPGQLHFGNYGDSGDMALYYTWTDADAAQFKQSGAPKAPQTPEDITPMDPKAEMDKLLDTYHSVTDPAEKARIEKKIERLRQRGSMRVRWLQRRADLVGKNDLTFWHGTTADNVQSIQEQGLIPQRGAWVQEFWKKEGPNLVYASDEFNISSSVNAMLAGVARKIGKEKEDVSIDDVKKYGAIVEVIFDQVFLAQDASSYDGSEILEDGLDLVTYEPRTKKFRPDMAVPSGVERDDFFSFDPGQPVHYYVGDELIRFLKDHESGIVDNFDDHLFPEELKNMSSRKRRGMLSRWLQRRAKLPELPPEQQARLVRFNRKCACGHTALNHVPKDMRAPGFFYSVREDLIPLRRCDCAVSGGNSIDAAGHVTQHPGCGCKKFVGPEAPLTPDEVPGMDAGDREQKINDLLEQWNAAPENRPKIEENLKSLRAMSTPKLIRNADRNTEQGVTSDDVRVFDRVSKHQGDKVPSRVIPAGSRVIVRKKFNLSFGGNPRMAEITWLNGGNWFIGVCRADDLSFAGGGIERSGPDEFQLVEDAIVNLLRKGPSTISRGAPELKLSFGLQYSPDGDDLVQEVIGKMLDRGQIVFDGDTAEFSLLKAPEPTEPEHVTEVSPEQRQQKVDALLDQLSAETDPKKKQQIEQRLRSLRAAARGMRRSARDVSGPPYGLNEMVSSYIEAALWSSIDEEGTNLDDSKYSDYEIDDASKEAIIEDCRSFMEKAGDLLDGLRTSAIGHDFWLTRCGHGAGFWDGDYDEEVGKKLTDLSEEFGEIHIVADPEALKFRFKNYKADQKRFEEAIIRRLQEGPSFISPDGHELDVDVFPEDDQTIGAVIQKMIMFKQIVYSETNNSFSLGEGLGGSTPPVVEQPQSAQDLVGPKRSTQAPQTQQSAPDRQQKVDALLDQYLAETDPAKKEQLRQQMDSLRASVYDRWMARLAAISRQAAGSSFLFDPSENPVPFPVPGQRSGLWGWVYANDEANKENGTDDLDELIFLIDQDQNRYKAFMREFSNKIPHVKEEGPNAAIPVKDHPWVIPFLKRYFEQMNQEYVYPAWGKTGDGPGRWRGEAKSVIQILRDIYGDERGQQELEKFLSRLQPGEREDFIEEAGKSGFEDFFSGLSDAIDKAKGIKRVKPSPKSEMFSKDIAAIPEVDPQAETDRLLGLLSTETDPEKKKQIEQKIRSIQASVRGRWLLRRAGDVGARLQNAKS